MQKYTIIVGDFEFSLLMEEPDFEGATEAAKERIHNLEVPPSRKNALFYQLDRLKILLNGSEVQRDLSSFPSLSLEDLTLQELVEEKNELTRQIEQILVLLEKKADELRTSIAEREQRLQQELQKLEEERTLLDSL